MQLHVIARTHGVPHVRRLYWQFLLAGLTSVEYRVRWHDEAGAAADGDDAAAPRRVTVELDP